MIYDIVISDQAETDLREIFEYIAFELQAPENASGQLDRLEACIMDLDHMPKRYRQYELASLWCLPLSKQCRLCCSPAELFQSGKAPYQTFSIKLFTTGPVKTSPGWCLLDTAQADTPFLSGSSRQPSPHGRRHLHNRGAHHGLNAPHGQPGPPSGQKT